MVEPTSLDQIREERRLLRKGGDDGHDGGMPPDDLRERVTRIEIGVESITKSLDKLSTGIGDLTKQVGGLAERVASIEGQLRHIPSIWPIVFGQIAAAVLVAGIVGAAFNYGISASPKPEPKVSASQPSGAEEVVRPGLLPAAPPQQPTDRSAPRGYDSVAYCSALADLYRKSDRIVRPDKSVDDAMAQCAAGNVTFGIPVLEKALTDAKVPLPPRQVPR